MARSLAYTRQTRSLMPEEFQLACLPALEQFKPRVGYEYIHAPLNSHYSINNNFDPGARSYHIRPGSSYRSGNPTTLTPEGVKRTNSISDRVRRKRSTGQLTISPGDAASIFLYTIRRNEANSRMNRTDTTSHFDVMDVVAHYEACDTLMISDRRILVSLKGGDRDSTCPSKVKVRPHPNANLTFRFPDVFLYHTRSECFQNISCEDASLSNRKGVRVSPCAIDKNIPLVNRRDESEIIVHYKTLKN